MADFDITPYVHMSPKEVRERIRAQEITFPTAGMAAGYAQANLVILPGDWAADFETFCSLNPFPCPVLEILRGTRLHVGNGDEIEFTVAVIGNKRAVFAPVGAVACTEGVAFACFQFTDGCFVIPAAFPLLRIGESYLACGRA